jgi:eukaryotic-like serine/threonine-protein kinase
VKTGRKSYRKLEPKARVELATCRLRIELIFPIVFVFNPFNLVTDLLFWAWLGAELATQFDFGLAKFSPVAEGGVSTMPTATEDFLLTSPGATMGTVAYMSPEQARGEELDARTDLFSFGAVLYEMTTGWMAFQGNSAAVIYDAILNRTLVPASQVNQGLPAKIDEIINKASEKDRRLRYQSAADIRTDLQRFKRDTESARLPVARSTSVGEGVRRGIDLKVVVPAALVIAVSREDRQGQKRKSASSGK